jgi:hypothetical protein
LRDSPVAAPRQGAARAAPDRKLSRITVERVVNRRRQLVDQAHGIGQRDFRMRVFRAVDPSTPRCDTLMSIVSVVVRLFARSDPRGEQITGVRSVRFTPAVCRRASTAHRYGPFEPAAPAYRSSCCATGFDRADEALADAVHLRDRTLA